MPASPASIAFAFRNICIFAAMTTAMLLIAAAQPWSGQDPYDGIGGFAGLLGFLALAISPYAGLMLAKPHRADVKWKALVALVITVFIAGAGIAIMYDANLVNPDPQSGIVFLIVPVYQWLIIGAMLFVFSLIKAPH